MRCDYQFRYVTNDGQSFNPQQVHTIVATSDLVTVKGGNLQPSQGHISFEENPDEVHVMWSTGGDGNTNLGISTVMYGLSSNSLTQEASSKKTTTYTIEEMCGRPANIPIQPFYRDPGRIHLVTLKALKPNTLYFYRFGSNVTGFSPVYSFRTKPIQANSTTFIFYGDMGSDFSPRAVETVKRVLEEPRVDFILHAGDLSYSMGFMWMWDYFFNVIEPVATKIPYYVSVGNHELDEIGKTWTPSWGNYGNDSGGECGLVVQKRFKMPNSG